MVFVKGDLLNIGEVKFLGVFYFSFIVCMYKLYEGVFCLYDPYSSDILESEAVYIDPIRFV